MKFVVYRESWARGQATRLLNYDNTMCCLGQVCYQLGVPPQLMLGVDMPRNVMNFVTKDVAAKLREAELLDEDMTASWVVACARVNDSRQYKHDETREKRLMKEFGLYDHELEFVDGLAPWFKGEKG